MRVAYLTTDEVNLTLAEQMAAACGVTLCPLAPKDTPPDGGFDAVLYDWDYWPADLRQRAAASPRTGPPVALHGYNVRRDEAADLRRRGVAVHRRLRPKVFRLLRQDVLAARVAAATPPCPPRLGGGAGGGGRPPASATP